MRGSIEADRARDIATGPVLTDHRPMPRRRPLPVLHSTLENFLARADRAVARHADPVELVHAYHRPADQEVVAFLTATLAFGRVEAIKGITRRLLDPLGSRPSRGILAIAPRQLRRSLSGVRYRWLTSADLGDLVLATASVLREHGTLESAFAVGLNPGEDPLSEALSRFSQLLRERLPRRTPTRGTAFLLPSPRSGSACKRFCLFLRWMARPADGVDLGLWTRLPPSELVVPLDTHLVRIARYLALTQRRTPGWPMALEVTRSLRRLNPSDPLRYEFALCHLGISGRCPSRRVPAICRTCDLGEICTLPRRNVVAPPPS